MVGCGWLLLFLGGFWMVTAISGWALDGCADISWWVLDVYCKFPGGLWMVTATSGWPLDGCCSFLVGSEWPLLFLNGLRMVSVVSWWTPHGYPWLSRCLFLQTTQCHLTPRLISMLRIHTACSTQKASPCSPCPVNTFWHIHH